MLTLRNGTDALSVDGKEVKIFPRFRIIAVYTEQPRSQASRKGGYCALRLQNCLQGEGLSRGELQVDVTVCKIFVQLGPQIRWLL